MRKLIMILSLTILVCLGALAWIILQGKSPVSEAEAVPIGGPFELTRQDGQRVSDADFSGRYMLLYFGYTFCPDVCPVGLATMMGAYDSLDPDLQDAIAPVFITVDPARDTVQVMADYTELFHPDLVGLTGTEEEIAGVLKAFRIYARKTESEEASDYLVDHSAFTYLMGPDGRYVTHFSHGTTPDEMAERLRELVAPAGS